MSPHRIAGLALVLSGCYRDAATVTVAPPPPPPSPPAKVPAVAIISSAEWDACQAGSPAVIDNGLDPESDCDGQVLEGGTPLRYQDLPAIAADGSLLAVVEERDGWGHVEPGIRLIDREGHSVTWLALGGTGATVSAAVSRANAALRERAWVPLGRPEATQRMLADDHRETRFSIGRYTAVYERRDDGNSWLPPSRITVTAKGRMIVSRTDTEAAWLAEPRCNLPAFELVGASASPGVILFRTGLGMGGHDCDGVKQPPTWHVLAFADR